MASNGQNSRQMPPFPTHAGGASRYAQIVIKEPNTSEPKKAKRKRITPEQLKELTAVFENSDTPTHDIREELSKKLCMTNREVQVWFQNRRAKFNRLRLEQQRQIRTNAAILYNSGLIPGAAARMRLPVPMSLSPLPQHQLQHQQLQQHPPYGYPPQYCSAAVVSPDSADAARHAVSTSATPLTPTAAYQYAHIQPSSEYAGIVPQTQTLPLASAPLLYGPLPPTSPEHMGRLFGQGCTMRPPLATRRNTVSAYQAAGMPARMSPPALSPPLRVHAYETSSAAAARSRYLSAVPSVNNRDDHRYAGSCASPPVPDQSCTLAGESHAHMHTHSASADVCSSSVTLPSIQAMLSGADNSGDRRPTKTCVVRSPMRVRAYSSPSPGLAASASDNSCTDPGPLASIHNGQPPKLHAAHPQPQIQDSGDQRRFGCHRASSSSEAQFRDAKMGIDVLATAAISVSSAKSSGSLPHLTPLSEFSFRATSQQYGSPSAVPSSPVQPQLPAPGGEGGGRSGMQSRKMTPVDNSRSARNWRPW
ncbi:hypothetical protein LPJ77_003793 [Coemansia sp. RSA 2523]|nr:hypothetical protein LPJ69_000536 [Coemansia sp. RSA 1752]KAJ1775854.1 hypothetical protein LPJ54_003452 [Coemansia sp. RSA 1824]KAJ1806153.1 hypothetical protein LPJ77_003793 [Coemansia sp. RSA 2523]